MSVLRGLYTGLAAQSAAAPVRQRTRREQEPAEQSEVPGRAWSSGAKHGALIQVALAQKDVDEAGALRKAMFTRNQDIARICFSVFSRGRNSAQSRSVSLE